MTSQTLPITTLPTRPGFSAWMDDENVYIYQKTDSGMTTRTIPLATRIYSSMVIEPVVKNKHDRAVKLERWAREAK